jgi:hypothetical protein
LVHAFGIIAGSRDGELLLESLQPGGGGDHGAKLWA